MRGWIMTTEKLYRVRVRLEYEDEVWADNKEQAFWLVSDKAVSLGDWDYDVEEIEE